MLFLCGLLVATVVGIQVYGRITGSAAPRHSVENREGRIATWGFVAFAVLLALVVIASR